MLDYIFSHGLTSGPQERHKINANHAAFVGEFA
jgi:hypothetical protein